MPQAAETISQDIPCISCGYNLRTLAKTGRCPECGSAVAASINNPFHNCGPSLTRRIARILLFMALLNTALAAGMFALPLAETLPASVTSHTMLVVVLAAEIGAGLLFSILQLVAARSLSMPPQSAGPVRWPTDNISTSIGLFAFSAIPLSIVAFCMFFVEIPFFSGFLCVICFLFVTVPSLAFYGYRLGDFLSALCKGCGFRRLAGWFVCVGRAVCLGLFCAEFLAFLAACLSALDRSVGSNLGFSLTMASLIIAAAGFLLGTILLFIASAKFRNVARQNTPLA